MSYVEQSGLVLAIETSGSTKIAVDISHSSVTGRSCPRPLVATRPTAKDPFRCPTTFFDAYRNLGRDNTRNESSNITIRNWRRDWRCCKTLVVFLITDMLIPRCCSIVILFLCRLSSTGWSVIVNEDRTSKRSCRYDDFYMCA